MSRENEATFAGLGKGRIEGLTDNIFSTVMTVLVLSLSVPIITSGQVNTKLLIDLESLWPNFVAYAVSFVVLGVYWVGHHSMFHFIKRTNRAILWLNMIFLLCIGIIPFSTAVIGRYSGQQIAVIAYGANLTAAGITLNACWMYATHNRRLVAKDLDIRIIKLARKRIIVGPLICLTGILVSFLNTEISLILYGLMPIFYILPGKIDVHLTHPH
jgi:uncharacterized membrane protein